MPETIRLETHEGVALLTLDAPRRRNAFDLEMVREVGEAFDHLEAEDGARAVIIAGAPPAFCAGADLSHLEGAEEEGLRRIYEGFLRVARSPLPTVAAVGGPAVGAGMNLALACDLRLAGRSARFDCRFLALGLHPGGGHTWMLQRVLGPQGAAAMLLFGEVLDGEEAVRQGLAWRLCEDDELLDEARRLAARAASAPPELVRRAKATWRDMGAIHHHPEAVERELGEQVWSVRQPAFADRLKAMRKRIEAKTERG